MRDKESRTGLRRLLAVAGLTLALCVVGGAPPAEGVVTTYRWQVQTAGAIGSSGYTADWPAACGGQPDIDNNLSPIVTTMSTAAYCGDDRMRNRRPAAPHDIFLMIKDTAYAGPTTVTGQATGNRWALEDAGGGGKAVRLTLGYAQGGIFTGWGFVDIVIPDSTNNLFLPDMSAISGTAPSGSHLALLVTKQVGINNSRVIFYFADLRQGGDQSGQISVDEVAAANATTLGDGTDPAAGSLCPGDAEVVANQFTLQTDGNTDAVNDLTVTLATAGSFNNLSQVRITSLGGGTQYGVVNNPAADTLVISLTGLDATTTLATFEVRITPKTDAGMPTPPGASYATTAPVTAFTPANNTTAGSDNDTEATTVDNASPGVPSWGTITPGDGQITLAWTDPGDADFQEVIIVRKQGAAVANVPVEGTTYIVGQFLDPGPNTEEVVFVGTDASSPWTDTGLTNGENYWYRIFARDNPCVNWSQATGSDTGPHSPVAAGPVTTLGDGADPAAGSLCPGDAEAVANQFTFQTDGNTDAVNDLTVTLAPAGSFNNLSQVRITSLGGGTQYGVVNNPAADSLVISLTGLDATASLATLEVRITPDTQAGMPAPPGASYATTAPVTDFTPATNSKAGSDNDTEATTVDNGSPANPGWGTITPGDNQLTLSWTDPGDADFQEVIIVRKQGGAVANVPVEGTTYSVGQFLDPGPNTEQVVFLGTDASSPWTDTGVTNGQSYWYRIFARDNPCVNWSTGANTGPHTPSPAVPDTLTVAQSGTGGGNLTQGSTNNLVMILDLSVDANSATLTDLTLTRIGTAADSDTTSLGIKLWHDVNDNNAYDPGTDTQLSTSKSFVTGSVSFDAIGFPVAAGTPEKLLVTFDIAAGAGNRTIGGQVDSAAQVTVASPDLVALATTPLTGDVFAIIPAPQNGTTVTSTSAAASSCNQITVTALFAGDANWGDSVGGGNIFVEYNDGAWQPGCAEVTGPSPRQCIIPGLAASTSYPVRVTYNDPDGVSPDANGGPTDELINVTPDPSTGPCGADDAAPTVLFLTPRRDGVLGGTDRVKVQVYDKGGLAVTDPVQWSVDGAAVGVCPVPYCAVAVNINANYDCNWAGDSPTTCNVYQFDLDSTQLANDSHFLTVQVTDAAGNVARVERPFQAQNDLVAGRPGGSGQLLRRTPGSQICKDCHNLPTHSSQMIDSGYGNWAMECLSCHTPHDVTNIFLIREVIETPNSGARAVRFEDNTIGSQPNSSTPGSASFVNEDNATQADGPCQACHTRTGGATARWRNVDAGGNVQGHYTDVAGTQPCTNCHTHDTGFRGAGGCTACHFTGGPAVDAGRRPVEVDFAKTSHHVGTASGVALTGTLTDLDCVVCHAEGDPNGNQVVINGTYHNDNGCLDGAGQSTHCIDLKNADNVAATPFAYNKQLLIDNIGTSTPAEINAWSSGNADWETETSNRLDPFCLTCHDADGALQSRNENPDETCGGGNPLNPFCDGTITNDYDRVDRTRVVDINSKVTHDGVDRDTDPGRDAQNIPDPPEGVYSRHAIRGRSASVYVDSPDVGIPAVYWNRTNFAWNDGSVMGCADCHTVDGANTTDGNAHGSNSEYLLKNVDGLAIEGDYDVDPTLADFSYICYRCHTEGYYRLGSLRDHTDNSGDWAHTANEVGAADRRNAGNDGNIFGIACLSCHGGAPSDPPRNPTDPVGYGAIHGTSEVYDMGDPDTPFGTRNAYRFTNGANMRYFHPDTTADATNDWTDTTFNCWTLNNADNWGACTQHGGGDRDYTRAFTRGLSY